jgi:serine/threonine-protein kinase
VGLAPGTRLGAYEIVSLIGTGGMGDVFRARDTRLLRDVAIKVLPPDFAARPDALARFEREAQTVAALSHPHIVVVHDVGRERGISYLVMELVEGETLRARLANGPLPESVALNLARQIASALLAAHAKGIVHRDLKPENLILSGNAVKILDFGLSKSLWPQSRVDMSTPPTMVARTEPGAILGTVGYMSPEQVRGDEADTRSDIFAFGVTLFEMLTGERAFKGGSAAEQVSAILRDHPDAARSGVRPALRAMLDRCLEKERSARMQSAQELVAMLDELVAEPSAARLAPPAASVAVLPFTDLSPAKDQEWFCDGIAEEILNALAQVKGLSVAARASAFAFRGRGDDLRAIGTKLHVTTVLDGSVRRAADRLRVTARLSDVANGYQIWSDRYDRDAKDVFDVQDEIARAIVDRLKLGLADDDAPRVVRHTQNQEAYHLYLRGRHLWYARQRGALRRARTLFEEATRRDPDYVLPYVGLADLFAIEMLYGFEREDVVVPQAQTALARALALNDRVAEAHRAQGFLSMFVQWDMHAAVAAFERAITLDPTNGLAYTWLGWPAWPGRAASALAAIRRAVELDPLNPYVHSLAGAIHDFYGQTEQAIGAFDKAFEIDGNYLVGLYLAGGFHSRHERHDESLRLMSRAVDISDRATFYVAYHAWALARAGHVEEARLALNELEQRSASEYVQALHFAIVNSALGQLDRAFELLDQGVHDGNAWIGSPQMPMFDDFRRDPRFAAHLRRINHPEQSGRHQI